MIKAVCPIGRFLIAGTLLLNSCLAVAQSCPKSENKKALRFQEEAESAYKSRKYEDALDASGKAIDADPEYADAYLLQGYAALKKRSFGLAEESLQKAIELCESVDPEAYYQLGWLYYDLKKWKESERYLSKFTGHDRINEEHRAKAELMLARAKLYAHPVPFDPQPVKDLSTPDPEYLPYISPDQDLAFFTRRFELKDKNMLVPQSVEKFMLSKRTGLGVYERGAPMPLPFNQASSNNEGGATITIDNKHLFFTVNTKGNFDICTSDRENGQWGEIRNLGPNVNDPKQWDSQPTIAPDGKTLYFASARDAATGIDLYVTTRSDDGTWNKARKLPPPVNTNGNDKSPFFHSDARTLYFSSDSLPGLGGYDIYFSRQDEKGNWSKPVNLGYPINTEADEVGFFVSTDGKKGFFSSNKLNNGAGGFDIYSFDLYEGARPGKVYFQKGDLNGPEDADPLPATIEIKDAVTRKLTRIDVDSVTGEYAFVVNFDHDLLVSVKKEGYAFESQYVSRKDTARPLVVTSDLQLKKLEVGAQYPINDILFGTNSSEINDTIKTVLDDFAEYLQLNPKLRVGIQGHTDNVGNPGDNMALSERRAKAVFDYLVGQGITATRMTHKGYGETKPLFPNATEAGRAKNRRTVFVVSQN
ncbi:MAG TPA: OmpA family protein [Bacteroidia bacterium]|nr:OmpA family protein [Bacteroidia bacterium]